MNIAFNIITTTQVAEEQIAFWHRQRLLFYALHSLLTVIAFFSFEKSLIIPLCGLWHPVFFVSAPQRKKFMLQILTALIAAALVFGVVWCSYTIPNLTQKGMHGESVIDITSIQFKEKSFGPTWVYSGTIHCFEVRDPKRTGKYTCIAKNVPYRMYQAVEQKRLDGHGIYLLAAKIVPSRTPFCYRLKATTLDDIELLSSSACSLTEWRLQCKQAFYCYLKQHFSIPGALQFLRGITVGEVDDRFLALELGNKGLQHILAISGLHFSLLIALVQIFLRLFLPFKWCSGILILALTLYFLLLGPSASVQRAWLAAVVALGGDLVERGSAALNTLGFTLLMAIFFSPLSCFQMGFQFSFVATAAILFFYPAAEVFMQNIWQKQPLSRAIEFTFCQQHGCVVLAFFRSLCALALAVHLASLPVMLYYFDLFRYMGLFYNLFFPFAVSIVLLLALLAFLAAIVFPLGLDHLLHQANQFVITHLLASVEHLPQNFDFAWQIENLPLSLLLIILTVLLLLGISRHQKQQQDQPLRWVY